MKPFQPTPRLVLLLFRAFEVSLLQQLHHNGVSDVTPSHLNVLRHLDNRGMKISLLAQDAALSKQLVGRIVKELVEKGYLKISPDASDGRAKFVCYTEKGRSLIKAATRIVAEIERNYEKELGSSEYKRFRKQLTQLTTTHQKEAVTT
ncbi:MAG TPA: MarR family transcriptional regulator [Chromatiales bacterium]|nr:MarR family transcriptional regulator [Chromatiales bacterium]